MPATGADAGPLFARPLCVSCRRCGRKRVFGSTSVEARQLESETLSRLVCRHCGARDATAVRLSDDREAARWLKDR
ncbi:hypothetical protein [Hansschlegelia zhihuaiae]|uniref:Uncharacterized protein n=1 Tax=Hansschlegelia zhihuaiae TaxID=405005 RepID=A0A4Q0M6Y5_9HYPH|nr:hypothetical protein [Hansschlegelia zhihuaiae]RXF68764.1 hypothetical protein EK403_19585 [Hansschlegelia zhihuaiae]